jgi:hypothetical protein
MRVSALQLLCVASLGTEALAIGIPWANLRRYSSGKRIEPRQLAGSPDETCGPDSAGPYACTSENTGLCCSSAVRLFLNCSLVCVFTSLILIFLKGILWSD